MTPEQIKSLRKVNGWNQADLANRLGIDQATVSRMENGTLSPSGPVRLLLEVLGSPPKRRAPQPDRIAS